MPEAKTILVVDDDQDLRAGLKAVLQKNGFSTLEADDGLEARRLIDRHRPDLVILDMMMPHWGGLAVLDHFKGLAGAPPFIMITANEGKNHKEHARRSGAVDYILKPFTMKRLLGGVAKTLGKAPARASTRSFLCRCPGCGARIKAPIQILGQTRTCPGCQREFVVQLATQDEGPMLLP